VYHDKDNPRIEVEITEVKGEYEVWRTKWSKCNETSKTGKQ
jgi:hypothetical protein